MKFRMIFHVKSIIKAGKVMNVAIHSLIAQKWFTIIIVQSPSRLRSRSALLLEKSSHSRWLSKDEDGGMYLSIRYPVKPETRATLIPPF
jgi:hypothetical protein